MNMKTVNMVMMMLICTTLPSLSAVKAKYQMSYALTLNGSMVSDVSDPCYVGQRCTFKANLIFQKMEISVDTSGSWNNIRIEKVEGYRGEYDCCFFDSGTEVASFSDSKRPACKDIYEGSRQRGLEFNLNKPYGRLCLNMLPAR